MPSSARHSRSSLAVARKSRSPPVSFALIGTYPSRLISERSGPVVSRHDDALAPRIRMFSSR